MAERERERQRQNWQAGLLSVRVLQAAAAANAWPHFPDMQADSAELARVLKQFTARQKKHLNIL